MVLIDGEAWRGGGASLDDFIDSSTKPTLFDLIIHVEFLFNKYLLSFISVLPHSTRVFDSLYFFVT